MKLTVTSAVTQLPVGPFMSHRSKMMSQIKRDNLALQVGGWVWGLKFYTVKFLSVETLLTVGRRPGKNKDLRRYEDDEL